MCDDIVMAHVAYGAEPSRNKSIFSKTKIRLNIYFQNKDQTKLDFFRYSFVASTFKFTFLEQQKKVCYHFIKIKVETKKKSVTHIFDK